MVEIIYGGMVDETGELVRIGDLTGFDLTGYTVVPYENFSEEDLAEFRRGNRSWNKETQTLVVDYSILHNQLHTKIDREAGEMRKNFITSTEGQEATYLRKLQEANTYVPGGDPKDTPMLTAEARVRKISLEEMVAMIKTTAAQWDRINVEIEAARIATKLAVSMASNEEEKRRAAQIDWSGVWNAATTV